MNLVSVVAERGLLLVFANVLLQQLGVPVPAEPTLVVAGSLAARGLLPLPQLVGSTWLAVLIADSTWYWMGRRYGNQVLRVVCRLALSPDSCVRSTEQSFARWGLKSLAVAKFIPGFSMVAPPMAGAMRVRWSTFLLFRPGGGGAVVVGRNRRWADLLPSGRSGAGGAGRTGPMGARRRRGLARCLRCREMGSAAAVLSQLAHGPNLGRRAQTPHRRGRQSSCLRRSDVQRSRTGSSADSGRRCFRIYHWWTSSWPNCPKSVRSSSTATAPARRPPHASLAS